MDKQQLNQFRMGSVLDTFLQKSTTTDALAASPIAQQEAADVRDAYALVRKATGQGTTSTEENTIDANTAEKDLLRLLPALLGPLASIARKSKNATLLARATVQMRQLTKLRPQPLRDVVDNLLADARTYQKELAPYGYSAAVHTKLSQQQETFSKLVGSTRTLLNDGKTIHATEETLLHDFMKQCYELDDVMHIFRALNPDFYQAYRTARRVGKSGGGKGKGGEDAASNG